MAEGVVPIPDAVWSQVRDAIDAEFHDVAFRVVDGKAQYRAAQVAARAAVIQELREWVAEFEKASKDEDDAAKLPGTDDEGEIACRYLGAAYTNAADWLRDRVADLEGGA